MLFCMWGDQETYDKIAKEGKIRTNLGWAETEAPVKMVALVKVEALKDF